jgi:TRAP-type mannitol/chloroaromatic compound transport system substrate-binding protein
MLNVGVNERVWSSLSADLQEIVRRAAGASAFEPMRSSPMRTPATTQAEGSRHGSRQFPADVVSAMARASEELIQEIASKGSFERQVYESFMTYRKAANAYAQVADLAQLQVRASVVKQATGRLRLVVCPPSIGA